MLTEYRALHEKELGDAPSRQHSLSTVAAVFRRQCVLTPSAVACRSRTRSMTYAELDRASTRYASDMARRGAGLGRCVAFQLPRSVDAIVVMLAALKLGAPFVPIDLGYPHATVTRIIRDCNPALIIVDDGTSATAAGAMFASYPFVPIDYIVNAIDAPPTPQADMGPETLAYVMYTSGSTGRPKGVLVPNRAILRLVINPDYAALGPEEVILQLAPLSFDACIFEIFGALLNGGTLVIETAAQPTLDDISSSIVGFGVTTLWLTAGLFHLMVEQRVEALRGLRQLLAGGDVLSPAHVRRMLREAPSCRLINGYGPTENTTFTCCYVVPPDWDGITTVPIGRAIRGTQVKILDESLRPTPSGETGELCAFGDGLAHGYLNQTELTEQRFVSDESGSRCYRTGDLARLRADGAIEFLGRVDRQIKINGKRIEPEEIEGVLRQLPPVRDAIVLVDEADGARRLMVFVAADEGEIRGSALAEHLAGCLPAWMRPSRTVILQIFPLTVNGKVDRAALLTMARSSPVTEAPRGLLEQQIGTIWASVLHVPAVDRTSSFFDCGGTSLHLLELQEAIRRSLGHDVSVVALFAHPSISALATHLDATGQPAALPNVQDRAARQLAAMQRVRHATGARPDGSPRGD